MAAGHRHLNRGRRGTTQQLSRPPDVTRGHHPMLPIS